MHETTNTAAPAGSVQNVFLVVPLSVAMLSVALNLYPRRESVLPYEGPQPRRRI